MNYRLIYAGLGLALVAVIALFLAFGSVRGRSTPLPALVEGVSPRPGDSASRQTPIEIDMVPGYDLEIFVDGVRIPDAELIVVSATGVYQWRPGQDRLFEEWSRGEHRVRILWNTSAGLSDAGEYEWVFFSF